MENYLNTNLTDLDGEVWMPIKGWEGLYCVSNMGRVKSIGREVVRKNNYGVQFIKEKILKQFYNDRSYCVIFLSKKGVQKRKQVHRLVAEAFIPNPENKKTVNHIKGNTKDNRVTELEWNTQSENNLHSIRVLGKKVNTKGIEKYWLGKKRDCFWLRNKRPNMEGALNHKSKKISCDTLGITFNSIKEASVSIGLSVISIGLVLSGKRSHSLGLHFRYI